jgi:sulfur carrier protein ThiS
MVQRQTLEIHLQLYSVLREKLPPEAKGRAILNLEEGVTLADLLDELGIKRRVVISVNEEYEADLSRQLLDGDDIKIFSSISGG